MAALSKSLVPGSQLTTSAVVYYTVPTLTTTIITQMTLTNTTAGAVSATISIVNGAGAPAAINQLAIVNLAAYETKAVGTANKHIMSPGFTIQALASAGASITIKASGIEQV